MVYKVLKFQRKEKKMVVIFEHPPLDAIGPFDTITLAERYLEEKGYKKLYECHLAKSTGYWGKSMEGIYCNTPLYIMEVRKPI